MSNLIKLPEKKWLSIVFTLGLLFLQVDGNKEKQESCDPLTVTGFTDRYSHVAN